MAGNVRGAMRPNGRSPPFLLIGLCVALCILGFNYWSLSYRNRELGGQIVDLQDQVRRSMSKRMTAERRGASVVDELKKCENTLDMEKNEIARKESEVITLSDQLRSKVTEMTEVEGKIKEMEETRKNLKTCEENNVGINQELQKKKEELKAALQQAPGQDTERCNLCKGQWAEEKKNFFNTIEKVLGPTALGQLREAGVDIGIYAQAIDAQHKPKVDQQNPQGNGQALPQGQINPVNVANGQANQPAQDPNLQANQPAQDPNLQAKPPSAQDQNQLPQQPPVLVQQPVQGNGPVVMVQGGQDNNVPQGQPIQPNPPNPAVVNPAGGNVAETNALGVNSEGAAKANGVQSQNAVGNNAENPEVPHHGGDFVPVANPGVENAGQVGNDGQQANQVPAEKGADPAVANAGDQPVVKDDPALNRVERPSDMNKTTAGNSLMSLNKSNTPLPKEVLSAPNMSFSSRTPAQSVQTDTQAALHASQSNNTANNQTLDLRFRPGLTTANVAESKGQIKVKQNAGPDPNDDSAGKLIKDDSAKMQPGEVVLDRQQGGVVQDEDSIDKMQHNMNMEDDRMNHMKNLR